MHHYDQALRKETNKKNVLKVEERGATLLKMKLFFYYKIKLQKSEIHKKIIEIIIIKKERK